MPKSTGPLLVALLLSACRPPAPPESEKAIVQTETCATYGQRYRVEYERVSGDCGDLPPTVGAYDEEVAPGCWTRSLTTTWDGCGRSMVETCDDGRLNRLTSTLRFAPSGVSGGGTVSLERWSEAGALLCSGSYMLTWVRL